MTKAVRFSRQARAEAIEAAPWYCTQRPELRAEFLIALDDTIERILRYAPHIALVPEVDTSLGVKHIFMKRFPYSVYFIELPTRYRVLAVAHGRRLPLYWRERL